MFRLLVVGSRSFTNYDIFFDMMLGEMMKLDDMSEVEIVSGGAEGTDSMAKRFAEEHDMKFTEFFADWDGQHKKAGYIRNKHMHEYISEVPDRLCIAFWDGESKGTTHSFELAKKYNNPIKIIDVSSYKEE